MQRLLMSSIAAGLTFSMIGAPLAMAQQGPPQQHTQGHGPAPQHKTVQHETVQHVTVQHETIQHETIQRPVYSHPPMQAAQNWNHPAPGMQHPGFNGGHQWHRGDHFDGSRNYVSNWQQYHLNAPPRGYQWVQDNGQFVLIGVATGVIASVILNSMYQ